MSVTLVNHIVFSKVEGAVVEGVAVCSLSRSDIFGLVDMLAVAVTTDGSKGVVWAVEVVRGLPRPGEEVEGASDGGGDVCFVDSSVVFVVAVTCVGGSVE